MSYANADRFHDSIDVQEESQAGERLRRFAGMPKMTNGTLTTERLILRRWRDSDRKPFRLLNPSLKVMEFMPKRLTWDESDRLMTRFEEHFEEHGFGLFAAERRDTHGLIGFIGLAMPDFAAAFTPCTEIGWRLAHDQWGQGLATEGARAVMRFAFESAGLKSLVSFTVPANVRSLRVMEKLSMKRDTEADFNHPKLAEGHALRHHVLYRMSAEHWSHLTAAARSEEHSRVC